MYTRHHTFILNRWKNWLVSATKGLFLQVERRRDFIPRKTSEALVHGKRTKPLLLIKNKVCAHQPADCSIFNSQHLAFRGHKTSPGSFAASVMRISDNRRCELLHQIMMREWKTEKKRVCWWSDRQCLVASQCSVSFINTLSTRTDPFKACLCVCVCVREWEQGPPPAARVPWDINHQDLVFTTHFVVHNVWLGGMSQLGIWAMSLSLWMVRYRVWSRLHHRSVWTKDDLDLLQFLYFICLCSSCSIATGIQVLLCSYCHISEFKLVS